MVDDKLISFSFALSLGQHEEEVDQQEPGTFRMAKAALSFRDQLWFFSLQQCPFPNEIS